MTFVTNRDLGDENPEPPVTGDLATGAVEHHVDFELELPAPLPRFPRFPIGPIPYSDVIDTVRTFRVSPDGETETVYVHHLRPVLDEGGLARRFTRGDVEYLRRSRRDLFNAVVGRDE